MLCFHTHYATNKALLALFSPDDSPGTEIRRIVPVAVAVSAEKIEFQLVVVRSKKRA